MTGCGLLGHALIDGIGNVVKNENEGLKLIEMSFSARNPYSTVLFYLLNKDPNQTKALMKLSTDLGDYLAFRDAGIDYLE